jgi:tetratricopeptide (TPR) repeat protein
MENGWFFDGNLWYRSEKEHYDFEMGGAVLLLRKRPRTAAGLISRGNARVWWDHLDEAIADYSKALVLEPENIPAFFNRSALYERMGRGDSALAAATAILHSDPVFYPALLLRGKIYHSKGEYDRAIGDFTQALTLNLPREAPAFGGRAAAYLAKGDIDAAIEDSTRAISRESGTASYYAVRGQAYAQKGGEDNALAGYADQAIEDYNTAIALDPCDRYKRLRDALYRKNGMVAYESSGIYLSPVYGKS